MRSEIAPLYKRLTLTTKADLTLALALCRNPCVRRVSRFVCVVSNLLSHLDVLFDEYCTFVQLLGI